MGSTKGSEPSGKTGQIKLEINLVPDIGRGRGGGDGRQIKLEINLKAFSGATPRAQPRRERSLGARGGQPARRTHPLQLSFQKATYTVKIDVAQGKLVK